ncbi:MAG: hypothetical protein ACFFBD_19105 [Candidatus Hodarchaeota archaeon]
MIKPTTIPKIVKDLIMKQPFLEDAIVKGIINYAALGKLFQSKIEKILGKSVNKSAITMAISRYAKELKNRVEMTYDIRLVDTDIIIREDLFELTIHKTPSSLKKSREIYDIVDLNPRVFLTITHGIYETTIISNKRYRKDIEQIFDEEKIKTIKNLAAISIKLPDNAPDSIGLFYIITKAIAWAMISIIEIVSTFSELTLIIRDEDITLAHESIKNLIEDIENAA